MKKNGTVGVEKLLEKRESLVAQMDALKHKISGLEMAIELFDESPEIDSEAPDRGSYSVRLPGLSKAGAIRRLLREAGIRGLDSRAVVEGALSLGFELKLNSVASVLSRMKREGEVVYADGRYRLKEFTKAGRRLADATG
jgi:hypothetical protein